MKIKILCCAVSLILGLCLAPWVMAASQVAEGKCITYDKDKKIVTIEDYDTNFGPGYKYGHPTGKQSVYNVAGALIGIEPSPGDILRIAYEETDNQRVAIRIMNVSKQDLMKK